MSLLVRAVKGLGVESGDRSRIEATHVHAIAIGMGAGDVEGLDATRRAEVVLGYAGVERVAGETLRARLCAGAANMKTSSASGIRIGRSTISPMSCGDTVRVSGYTTHDAC